MVITTLPPPHARNFSVIVQHPDIEEVRFNTGIPSPYTVEEEIDALKQIVPKNKRIWIDLKCRQLRITHWAHPVYGRIRLNREIEAPHGSKIIFRGDDVSNIMHVKEDYIYVDPPPRRAVGAGQAVNVIGEGVHLKGPYLLGKDVEYVIACEKAKLPQAYGYMLSFVQSGYDIEQARKTIPDAPLGLKIENLKGVEWVMNLKALPPKTTLVIARDDLYQNLYHTKTLSLLFGLMKKARELDPQTIVASRLFESLREGSMPSLGDISDYRLLVDYGFRNFMLSDGMNVSVELLQRAWKYLQGDPRAA